MLVFTAGFIIGALLLGVIAHRWPNLFAKVVTAANAVDDKVNSVVKK